MIKSRNSTQILDEIAQQHTRIDVNLSSGILTKVRKAKIKTMKSKFVLSGALTIIFILVILFSVPSVANAMKRLFGYIPGAGLVESNTFLRALAQTSQIKQEGTTVSVLQGVIDPQKTIIVYQVENLPAFPATSETQVSDICHRQPELKLPDGSFLHGEVEGGNSWISGYNRRIVFPSLSNDVNSVNLVFSCLEQSIISPKWTKLEIPLYFVKVSADTQAYPLIDLPTPIPLPTEDGEGADFYKSDVRLVINQYAEADENLVLFGVLESLSGNNKIEAIDRDAIRLVDSIGKDIPLVEDKTIANPSVELPNEASHQWAYLTAGPFTAGEAVLTIDSAWIRISDTARFTIDLGKNPQPGQKYTINQSLTIAGREIVVQSAEINTKGNGISFTIHKPADVGDVTLMDLDHPLLSGGGGPDSYGFSYQEGIPSGNINLTITGMSVNIAGPWKTTINLPGSPAISAPTELQPACLTKSTWLKALGGLPALPEDLGGILAVYNPLPPDFNFHVMTVNLDGSNYQDLGLGDGISLSPDSRQIIYSSETGLQLMDLETRSVTPLANTWKNDRGPIWSPDGSKITFTRGPASGLIGAPGPYSIYITNPDGSQQVPVVENGDANTVMGWLPDGQTLLYTIAGPDGAIVNSINIATGTVINNFETNYAYSNVAISPDGNEVAFEEILPGDNYGIYTANLDGSNKKLIVDAAPIVVTIPQWSPDGKWLIVSVHDENFKITPVLALIEVDNCTIIPLTTLPGYVSTWNP
jgi:hypothetical protein